MRWAPPAAEPAADPALTRAFAACLPGVGRLRGPLIAFLEGKLGRPEFVARAPAEVVERERGRLAEQRRLRAKLDESLRAIAEGRGSG